MEAGQGRTTASQRLTVHHIHDGDGGGNEQVQQEEAGSAYHGKLTGGVWVHQLQN